MSEKWFKKFKAKYQDQYDNDLPFEYEEEEMGRLFQEIESLTQQLEETKKAFSDKNLFKLLGKKELELEAVKKEREEWVEDRDRWIERFNEANADKLKAEKEIELLQAENQELKGIAEGLGDNLETAGQRMEEIAKERDFEANESKEWQKNYNARNYEVERLEAENQKLRERDKPRSIPWGKEHENDGSAMRENIRKLNKEIESLRAERDELYKTASQRWADLQKFEGIDEQLKALETENQKLRERVEELKHEIQILRHYGSKDCTAQADERLEETKHLPISERWDL